MIYYKRNIEQNDEMRYITAEARVDVQDGNVRKRSISMGRVDKLDDYYKQIFEEVLRMTDDGFIIVDENAIVTNINERYCDFLGKRKEEVVGYPIVDTIPNSRMPAILKHGVTEELGTHKFLEGYVKNMEDNLVLVSRARVLSPEGDVVGAVAQVHFRPQAIRIAKRMMREQNELEYLREQYKKLERGDYGFNDIIGSSKAIQDKKKEAMKAAKTDFSVLLTGETGTGKEVFAKAIHNNSNRKDNPMISINCAAIPGELLESELFGYVDGAFTGAKKGGKKGKFFQANGGTIFLDEIGDMPLFMQAKLLRVLQEREIDPVGSVNTIPIDVRIIAATRKDLKAMIKEGTFREDLYYRLKVISMNIPPLRERINDVPELTGYFLDRLNQEYNRQVYISQDVIKSFTRYSWPGNVRELDNVVKGAYATCDGLTIELTDVPLKFQIRDQEQMSARDSDDRELSADNEDWLRFAEEGMPIKEKLERIEYKMIKDAYERFNSVRKAASFLGMSMATYVRKKNIYEEKYE